MLNNLFLVIVRFAIALHSFKLPSLINTIQLSVPKYICIIQFAAFNQTA